MCLLIVSLTVNIEKMEDGTFDGYLMGKGGDKNIAHIRYYRHLCDIYNTEISGKIFIPDLADTAVAVELGNNEETVGFSMSKTVLTVYQNQIKGNIAQLPKPLKKINWSYTPEEPHNFVLSFKNGKVQLTINDKPFDELEIETTVSGKTMLQLKVMNGHAQFDDIRIDFKK